MPMEKLGKTLNQTKDKINQNSLILDVCSLKMFACETMKRILPSNMEIIGTHPLFGPQSAPNSIEGMKIALVNVRARQETFERQPVFILFGSKHQPGCLHFSLIFLALQ